MIIWQISSPSVITQQSSLLSCISAEDSVILKGDAVYHANLATEIITAEVKALKADCDLRGLAIPTGLQLDLKALVETSAEATKIITL